MTVVGTTSIVVVKNVAETLDRLVMQMHGRNEGCPAVFNRRFECLGSCCKVKGSGHLVHFSDAFSTVCACRLRKDNCASLRMAFSSNAFLHLISFLLVDNYVC